MAKKELATMAQAGALTINEDESKNKALEYLQSMGNTLPKQTQAQFIEIAAAFGLNPFKREIYCIGYSDKWNIVTGYEVYIKRAERLGKLDGWQVDVNGSGEQLSATVTIYRKDWAHAFKHTAYYIEAVNKVKDGKTGKYKPSHIWEKMPVFMTKKVAIAQAFRLCFPDEFGGMPYTADELPEEEKKNKEPRNITPNETDGEIIAEVVEVAEKPAEEKPQFNAPPPELEEIGRLMAENDELFSEEEKTELRGIIRAQGLKVGLDAIKKAIEIKKPIEAHGVDLGDYIF